ncbi:Rho termination factor N-terminal domain-containing protein [Actinomadura sp. NEAU-AAG7]|nr:Rho termination factor N-terminal domain-containing protein [Actinomadura sp. NEAU-AAG7]
MCGRRTTGRGSCMPRAQIKNEKMYQRLREQGESKEKAARIANAAAGEGKKKVGRRGGKSPAYDDWTKDDLMKRAREIGVEGRSSMNKSELIDALRNH